MPGGNVKIDSSKSSHTPKNPEMTTRSYSEDTGLSVITEKVKTSVVD